MDCTCQIEIDHDGGPSFYEEKIRVARKVHKCDECHRNILPGEQYENMSGMWDGRFETYKTCMDCKSLRDAFFCSWTYTTLWEDFYAEFCGNTIPESCITELTPNARAKVCEYIEERWEDEDD